jgi:hypothetical protein
MSKEREILIMKARRGGYTVAMRNLYDLIMQEREEQQREVWLVSDGKLAKVFKREKGKTIILYEGSEIEAGKLLNKLENGKS